MITTNPSQPLYALDPMENAGPEQLTALQLQRLRHVLYQTWDRVAPFRQSCEAAGIHPDDLQTLQDLSRFPFTSKDTLRAHYPNGLFAVPMERIARLHASSGTTGIPTLSGYTRADLETWARLMARSMRTAGGRPGMRVQISFGYGLFTGGFGAHYGAEALGCTVIPISGGQTEKQVQFIRDLKPDIIMVTPSYMLVIADEMERQGMDPQTCSLQIGIFGAEPWTEELRHEIEERLALRAVDIYGLSEIMGPGVAMESQDAPGSLHLWEDHFYPEIIDPNTGEALPDGSFGELVLTTLTKEALPLIRYRTRDLTRLLPGAGRGMRRIQRISGRSDDVLIVRGVNLFPTQVEEIILRDPRIAPIYQLVVSKKGRMDSLEVKTELRPGLYDGSAASATKADLTQQIKAATGLSAIVSIEPENSVERSPGKAKRVIDLRHIPH